MESIITENNNPSQASLTFLYEQDFQLWIEQTINCLKNAHFDTLDTDHLIEELKDLGSSNKAALESNLAILIAHLLKLTVQADAPDTMKNSWYNSVDEHRQRIQKQLQKTPSLKSYWDNALPEAYPDARKLAIKEGQRASLGVRIPAETEYPINCPFSQLEILDENFYGVF
jgi:hypothetical protein